MTTVRQQIEDIESERREEYALVRRVLVEVFGASPCADPPGELRYRMPDGRYDDIFHGAVRWLGSTDGALALVDDLGFGVLMMRQKSREWNVNLYNDERAIGYQVAQAQHAKPARALVEAVLDAVQVARVEAPPKP